MVIIDEVARVNANKIVFHFSSRIDSVEEDRTSALAFGGLDIMVDVVILRIGYLPLLPHYIPANYIVVKGVLHHVVLRVTIYYSRVTKDLFGVHPVAL